MNELRHALYFFCIFYTEPTSKKNDIGRKRPRRLGQIGRKVTRHNLISRSDTLSLVPSTPATKQSSLPRVDSVGTELKRIESEENVEVTEKHEEVQDCGNRRPLVSQMSIGTLQREFELGYVLWFR